MAVFAKKSQDTKKGKRAPSEVRWRAGTTLIPVVSEKAERLRQKDQYVFAAQGKLSKVEVKKAVEGTYGVRVIGVNSAILPGKNVRRGRSSGTTKERHRFIVRVRSGETIDVTKAI